MSIRKLAVAVALSAFMAGGAVFAQGQDAAEEAAGEEAAEEAVEEEAAAPEPIAAPVAAAAPAPAVEAAPAAEAKPAAKPEPKVDFYGTASYRFRGRLWNAEADVGGETKSGSSFDYLNLLGWAFGAKVKVDDKLSLQFQIGNDLNAGEPINWLSNKSQASRTPTYNKDADNLYVHLAYATWNPGPVYLTGGVVPVASNGTLDLLERSLVTGTYAAAIYQTWAAQLNASLIALKLGVPIVKEGVKVNAELTYSIIDQRAQKLISSGDGGLVSPDADPKANPTSNLFILDVPVAAGDFKVTPQFTYIFNRNYNEALEIGDDEFLAGLSASYKVNDGVSLNLNGAYGTVSNEKSLVGSYGGIIRSGTNEKLSSDADKYVSTGLLFGLGGTIKAGPGAVQVSVSYGNSYNGADEYSVDKKDSTGAVIGSDKFDPKTLTNRDDILFDIRYTWNAHPKFSIAPRWRFYYTAYNKDSGHVNSWIENRPELLITGTF